MLNALATESELVLKGGTAYIKPLDGEPLPFGQYAKHDKVWSFAMGTNQDWILEKRILGLDLTSATNRSDRQTFVRSWLKSALEVLSLDE